MINYVASIPHIKQKYPDLFTDCSAFQKLRSFFYKCVYGSQKNWLKAFIDMLDEEPEEDKIVN